MLFSINQEKSIRHILNILLVLIITNADVAAQEMADTTFKKMEIVQDSVVGKDMESILLSSSNEEKAVEAKAEKQARDWNTWKPNVKKAMWMAIVIPGGARFTTVNTGSSRLSMEDLSVAPMLCDGTGRCILIMTALTVI